MSDVMKALMPALREWVEEGEYRAPADLDTFQFDGDLGPFHRWMEIYEKETGHSPGKTRRALWTSAAHSALLPWLYAGNEPLPYVPPKSFSRPWHQLCVDGCGMPLEVWVLEDTHVVINQSPWPLIAVLGEMTCLAEGPDGHPWLAMGVPAEEIGLGKAWILRRMSKDFTAKGVDTPKKKV
jgi:hypothetical protein